MRKLQKEEKLRRGTFDKSKIRVPLTFEPLTAIPDPLMNLEPDEMQYFKLCADVMLSNGTLTSADVPGITRAARMYGIYLQALKEIKLHGSEQTTKTGFRTKSGAFTVFTECEKLLSNFERSQGMNLISRSRLPKPDPPKGKNKFEEI
jgi:phage terminase small subunit